MKLTIAAQGGLCNRLRVLFGAMAVADELGQEVRLVWHPDWQCEAYFDELFLPIDHPLLRVANGTFLDRPSSHKELYLPQLLRLPLYRKQVKLFHPDRHGALADAVRRHRRLYINTGYQIAPYGPKQTTLLRPLPELQAQIDKIAAKFTPRTVGVHIRRTDNQRSAEISTDAAFIEAMRRQGDDADFFIASDDGAVKWELRNAFPARTYSQDTDGRRDNAFSVADAVIDLFCLARTRMVIGSYWSSFSDVAAELGQIPLEIARQ